MCCLQLFIFFFFNDTATTEIYTLSLHDALPILLSLRGPGSGRPVSPMFVYPVARLDRKSTRLNSSHSQISYAVFCLKKKNTHKSEQTYDNHPYPHECLEFLRDAPTRSQGNIPRA